MKKNIEGFSSGSGGNKVRIKGLTSKYICGIANIDDSQSVKKTDKEYSQKSSGQPNYIQMLRDETQRRGLKQPKFSAESVSGGGWKGACSMLLNGQKLVYEVRVAGRRKEAEAKQKAAEVAYKVFLAILQMQ